MVKIPPELPSTEKTPYDIDVATELAYTAARTTLTRLERIKVAIRYRTIYRVYDNSGSGDDVPIPSYFFDDIKGGPKM